MSSPAATGGPATTTDARVPMLGCVADDITGATDLASALTDQGWRTTMVLGVSSAARSAPPGCDAVVVALKSRNLPAKEAVAESMAALDWLRSAGIERYYLKYCSTFDSTEEGNIGPVAEAAMHLTGATQVVHAPSYPDNGRTVYQGHLFVGTALLSQSGMEHHPLTPMTDSNLVRVLAAQTSAPVGLLPYAAVTAGARRMHGVLSGIVSEGNSHVIADALTSADLDQIAHALSGRTLLAGGAAFGAAWARALGAPGAPAPCSMDEFRRAPAAVLAGSASAATRRQVCAFESRHPVRRLTVEGLDDPVALAREVSMWTAQHLSDGPVLVASDTTDEGVTAARRRFGHEEASERIERTLALVASHLVEDGVRRLVVAGGETSGAVAAALGVTSLDIGPAIATGVPWTISTQPRMAIAFKSGNFGGDDFFARALDDEEST